MTERKVRNRIPGWAEYLEQAKGSGRWKLDDAASHKLISDEWRVLADEQNTRDESPVIADLRNAGVVVSGVWNYVNGTPLPKEAVEVFLKHLAQPHQVAVLEGMARAIADPIARFAREDIKRLWKQDNHERVKNALALAVANTSNADDFDEVVGLLKDRSLGESRMMLLTYIARMKTERKRPLLESLRHDDQIGEEVERMLKKLTKTKK